MSSKYTWSRMTPNPVAHLVDPADNDFCQPLCGAHLDVRTQTLGDQPPSQYVPVCARCEARQRRLDRDHFNGLAARYRQALAKLIETDLSATARELAAVTSMTLRNERIAWRIYDAADSFTRANASGSMVETMMSTLPTVWDRTIDLDTLTEMVEDAEQHLAKVAR